MSINYSSQLPVVGHSIDEKCQRATEPITDITSVATGILIGTTCAALVFLSASVTQCAIIGSVIAITAVAYCRFGAPVFSMPVTVSILVAVAIVSTAINILKIGQKPLHPRAPAPDEKWPDNKKITPIYAPHNEITPIYDPHNEIMTDKTLYPPVVNSKALISDVFLSIVQYLDFDTIQSFSEVSKGCNGVVSLEGERRKKAVEGIAFGKDRWLKDVNLDVKIEPILPQEIVEILNSPCPNYPTKKIRDTHIIILAPRNLTPTYSLIFKVNINNKIKYIHYKHDLVDKSRWVLLTKYISRKSKLF